MSLKFQILLHPKAVKELNGIQPEFRNRIKSAMEELSESPEKGIPLNPSRFRRIRVGDYRAIYEIDRKERKVIVLLVGHRRRVYDEFRRLL